MVSITAATSTMNLPTSSSVDSEDLSLLVQELRELGFDAIRFASYRTAAKLRYIQKKSNFILIDLWNVIEGIRENGLNALDPYSIITVPKLESLVTSSYVNLNKRLPLSQQVDVYNCARYLLSWLLIAFDNEGSGRVRVFSVKVGLVTLCSGKLIDKLRYIFSQISDSNGSLVLPRFAEYLQEVLALTAMVLETPTFGYTEGLATTIFDGTSKVSINGFLDALLNDPGPPCLMWLPLMHTMANVEDVNHGIQCSICKIGNIQGFRYKCQKCSNFNMCQNCFWQGKTIDNHRTDHEVKEYSTNKPSGKGIRHSFRKSLRCVPEKSKKMPRFPDEPERCLNLSHIVPPSPVPTHNGFSSCEPLDAYTDRKMFALELGQELPYVLCTLHIAKATTTCTVVLSPSVCKRSCSNEKFCVVCDFCCEILFSPSRIHSYPESVSESDEEHRLIARYTARLASESKYPHSRTMSQTSMNFYETTQTQRDIIAQLEAKNREIMREIARLKAQQELDSLNGDIVDPVLMEELQLLRYHKSDLEEKLNELQDSRRHLMGQLEGLMKVLKLQQFTPKSTPESSPRSGKSPPMPIYNHPMSHGHSGHHRSAPATPHHSDTFTSLTGELRSAFSNSEDYGPASLGSDNPNNSRLRNDLLLAADSVTNAMSSLVKELNSGSDEDNIEGHIMKPLGKKWMDL
ncbi:Dystrobrevin beta [Orchesella cincta]|uniref:Dystrobrevin n=1 Tax=Orchesella cincta TaxID=48709 RepID=A0A1D2MXY0_ORCCI|nr:Dystrobrevin beta [Orchesella cincta]